MYRSSAIIIVCLMTAAFAGCLGDAKSPAKAPDDTNDAGSEDPAGPDDPFLDLSPPEPIDPEPTTFPAYPSPPPPVIDDHEEGVQVQVLSKDCLATIGLLGIRISAC